MEYVFNMPTKIDYSTFCAYPWYHIHIDPSYGRHLCCIADTLPGTSKLTDDEFWNSKIMKDLRVQFMEGKRPDSCKRCWYIEDQGIVESQRQRVLSESETYTKEEIENNTSPDGHTTLKPVFYDVRTVHCNLQCISCTSYSSSTHIALDNERGIGRTVHFEIDKDYEKSMADSIIESIKNKTCKKIYWAGGEPMMQPVHWEVMDFLLSLLDNESYSDYVKTILIFYNTNMSKLYWKKNHIPSYIAPLNPIISASLDGTHETLEYLRDGLTWKDAEKNYNEYKAHLNTNNTFELSTVFTAPVMLDIDRYIDFYGQQEIKIYPHLLLGGEHWWRSVDDGPTSVADVGGLSPELLPDHIFDRVINNCIHRVQTSKIINKEDLINVFKSYQDRKYQNNEHYSDLQKLIQWKLNKIKRDKYLKCKRTYQELLKILDIETYEWYNSIPVIEFSNI